MRLLFLSIPTYRMTLTHDQVYWNNARRNGSNQVSRLVSGIDQLGDRKSICRGLWAIATHASFLGHEIRWKDFGTNQHVSVEDARWAQQLWLYAMTPTIDSCLRIAREAKVINPSITVLLGGPHPQIMFASLLKSEPQIDFVSTASQPPNVIAQSINRPNHIPGIAYRRNNHITESEKVTFHEYREIVNPGILPSPLSHYFLNTSSTRGCSSNCSFCLDGYVPLQLRSINDLESELRNSSSTLATGNVVHFFDTSFSRPRSRCREVCHFLSAQEQSNFFSCDIESGTLDHSLLELLATSRIRFVSIGFESCNDDVLRSVSKNGSFQESVDTAKEIKAHLPNCVVKAYWLLGLPGSTPHSLKRELEGIEYVLREGIVDIVSPKYYVPYPGTVFFDRPHDYGLELSYEFTRFDRFTIPPVCKPLGVDEPLFLSLLPKCEQMITGMYARKLGISLSELCDMEYVSKRYNDSLYISDSHQGPGR